MTTISASEAKTHFGVLMDKAQKEPVTIEKQGRPVAVVISYDHYQEQFGNTPSRQEKDQALKFLGKWSKRPSRSSEETLNDADPRAQAIWEKFTKKP